MEKENNDYFAVIPFRNKYIELTNVQARKKLVLKGLNNNSGNLGLVYNFEILETEELPAVSYGKTTILKISEDVHSGENIYRFTGFSEQRFKTVIFSFELVDKNKVSTFTVELSATPIENSYFKYLEVGKLYKVDFVFNDAENFSTFFKSIEK